MIGKSMLLGQKSGPKSRLTVIAEFFIGKASENGGLANSRISNCDQFYLSDITLLILYFRHINKL